MNLATTAQPPFNGRASADVVLRTSDGVNFHVHKAVLSIASPFFEQMFSLTQPTPCSTPEGDPEFIVSAEGRVVPIIPITEDAQTLDHLLRLCYPVADPAHPSDLSSLLAILEAATKYEFEETTTLLRASLLTFVPASPLAVFAVACRLQLELEAGVAARKWRDRIGTRAGPDCQHVPHSSTGNFTYSCNDKNCRFRSFPETSIGSSYVDEMKDVPAGCYYRLLRYLRSGETTRFCDPSPNSSPSTSPPSSSPSFTADAEVLRRWPADIILKTSDEKLIPTHQINLAFASATPLLAKAQERGCPQHKGVPLIELDEDEATIVPLLQMCQPLGGFPSAESAPLTFEQARSVWAAAQKYGMTKVGEVARRDWMGHLNDTPTRVYLTAMMYGWIDEAKEAALRSTRHPILDEADYAPEMELVSSEVLYRLYKYQHEHRKVAAGVMEQYLRSGRLESQSQPPPPTTPPNGATRQRSAPPEYDIPLIAAPLVIRELRGYQEYYANDWDPYDGPWGPDVTNLLTESRSLIQNFRDAVVNVCLDILDEPNKS